MSNEHNGSFFKRSWFHAAFLILTGVAVLLRFASEAWIGEDALITFRTIDNFVNGYGLRWNIDERVQVSTHPLWLLVNAAVYAVTREIPYSLTTVSLVFSVAAYGIVALRLKTQPVISWLVFFILFAASKTLTLYGTSGFESSLGFLLLALFTTELLSEESSRTTRWGLLALYGGLTMFNRLDYILIIAPPLAFLGFSKWRDIRWRRVLMGIAPLLAWFLFALIYYGFAFPNTAPAKLSADIPAEEYMREGLIYAANLVQWDFVSGPIMILTLIVTGAAAALFFTARTDTRAGCLAALGVGVAFYALYVFRIGGGFLSGRFWTPVLFTSTVIIAFGLGELIKAIPRARPGLIVAVSIGALLLTSGIYAFAAHTQPWKRRGPLHDRSVAHLYLDTSHWTFEPTDHAARWQKEGLASKRQAEKPAQRHAVVRGTIGFFGMAAGPRVTIIDPHALADLLTARLPLKNQKNWRVGHLKRPIPKGYLHARQTGSLEHMDPSLREYYRRLHLVATGPLFSWERWSTIAGFHLGRYDHLVEKWKASNTR